jgi:hypothetical protein
MGLSGFFSDRRRRQLAVLAVLAVASLVAAFFALDRRAETVAPKYAPQTFFPGLAHRLNEATHIRIVSKKGGSFEVAFVPEKGWVLPGRADYPASFEMVKKTLVALAAMETVEPKTDRPDWFHYVDLDAPPKGDGVAVIVSGEKELLAALIVGKSAALGEDGVGLFVRKANENQSWLVKSPAEIMSMPSDWMDKTVMNVDRIRVATVAVRPASGPAYSVSRAKPSDLRFTLSPLPKGREPAAAGAADMVAAGAAGFTFDDIKPAGEFDFAGAARVVTKTFDGLTVTIDLKKQGEEYWAGVFAQAEPGKTEAAREAHDINAHAAGWAFKLQPYKAAMLAAPLESLLKPKK